jgi:hypothetical protein
LRSPEWDIQDVVISLIRHKQIRDELSAELRARDE